MRILSFLFSLFVSFSFSFGNAAVAEESMSGAEIFRRYAPSVVLIAQPDSQGSGANVGSGVIISDD